MIGIKYQGSIFAAGVPNRLLKHYPADCENVTIRVCARGGKHITDIVGEEPARRWLCDHGLRKSKARQLLDAELRNHGPFSNPKHPKRIK